MTTAISASNLGKVYRLGTLATGYQLMRERVAAAISRRRPESQGEDFWALRDVSFQIASGEVVGLIGKNGAGKSTLLKILSRITEPTEGEAHLFGRVSSLLEVGVGFHPELTGRENIALNGAVLGMSRSDIKRRFDDIVEFAEVSRFLDTPVKRYSSGMYVRLAFSVAAHLEPDILIVDEVLAVGDAAFQQKCLTKMKEIRSEGRTVIVVSHNMSTVGNLCHTVLWLSEGKLKMHGRTSEVVPLYMSEGIENDLVWRPRHDTTGSAFRYDAVYVQRGDTGVQEDAIPADAPIDIVFDFEILDRFPPANLKAELRNDLGEILFMSTSADVTPEVNHAWSAGRQRYTCRIPPHLLAPGRYFLSITEPYGGYDIPRENVVSFNVSEQNSLVSRDGRSGKIAPLLEWKLERR